jgi:hypothetical protein
MEEGVRGMVGQGAADQRKWRLEEDRAVRRRSHRRLRVAATGGWAGGEGGGIGLEEEETSMGEGHEEGGRRRRGSMVGWPTRAHMHTRVCGAPVRRRPGCYIGAAHSTVVRSAILDRLGPQRVSTTSWAREPYSLAWRL